MSTARVLWISISIHALREEGDGRHPVLCCFGYYFYPRPPRGGRRFLAAASMLGFAISIHALREEGDTNGLVAFANGYIFLSTPSARRATMPHPHLTRDEAISIHALREEGDKNCRYCIHDESNFYPRSPRGGRPGSLSMICFLRSFLSTPSARRATFKPEQSSVLQGLFLSTPSARRATGGSYLFLG